MLFRALAELLQESGPDDSAAMQSLASRPAFCAHGVTNVNRNWSQD